MQVGGRCITWEGGGQKDVWEGEKPKGRVGCATHGVERNRQVMQMEKMRRDV